MPKRSSCRVIAGRWRGRLIRFDDAEGLRPTTDRIRETAFNWLQSELAGSHCLDCFAGSGVMGFEAASRGAGSVLMLENNARTVSSIRENITMLKATGIEVKLTDALVWLQQADSDGRQAFDIIFLDPPYQSTLLPDVCELLTRSTLLKPQTKIYLEHPRNADIEIPESWQCLKSKFAGQVAYKLFANQA